MNDRWFALGYRGNKLAISRALLALVPSLPADNGEDFQSWLLRHGQTKQSIDRFWAPVLISALNDELDQVSLRYAALVFRDSFLKFLNDNGVDD